MKKNKVTQTTMAILSIVVLIALVVLFLYGKVSAAHTSAQLQNAAQNLTAETESEEESADTSEDESEEETEAETETTAAAVTYSTISCRGDGFISYGVTGTSYAEMLEELLSDGGYSVSVLDYTLDNAGSLSQMYYAGVSTDTIEAIIAAHEAALGASAASREVETRSMTASDLERDDESALPVICIGLWGGWNDDLSELVEQQTLILETYSQQDDFIILGCSADGSVSQSEYDEAMEEAWGEHYISLYDLDLSDYTSAESRQTIAQAIYEKLVELGYV